MVVVTTEWVAESWTRTIAGGHLACPSLRFERDQSERRWSQSRSRCPPEPNALQAQANTPDIVEAFLSVEPAEEHYSFVLVKDASVIDAFLRARRILAAIRQV